MEKEADGFECLYESHRKAEHGVMWKDSVAWFSLHGLEQCLKLSNELRSGTYKPKPPVAFTITKPKQRDIIAISYRDRVYQRSINDNILYPAMTESFIKENGACQVGRGTEYCMNLFKKQLRRFYINHGRDGYFLQFDIKKYYPSMDHDTVKAMFQKKLSAETYEAVAKILDYQYEGEVGYNPGSQMVQIAGISFLDGVDHFIKEKLHIKDYIRVMDDMVMIHESREYLEYCREEITKELTKLKLTPHEKKTDIFPISKGITFLGFTWRLTETGKVIMTPKSQNIREFRYILTKLMKMYARGERSIQAIEDSKQSRLDFIGKGNTYQLQKRLNTWYAERMKHYEHQRQQLLQEERAVSEGESGARQPESRKRKYKGPAGLQYYDGKSRRSK